jgi:endo-1,4-beta-xylanase
MRSKSDFLIGASVNRQIYEEDARTTALIVLQFNTIAPENLLKLSLVHPAPDKYEFDAADPGLKVSGP